MMLTVKSMKRFSRSKALFPFDIQASLFDIRYSPSFDTFRHIQFALMGPWALSAGLWVLLVLTLWMPTALAQQENNHAQVKALGAIGMTVSDMDRSVDFYSKVLSFEKVSDSEVSGPDYEHLLGVFGLRIRVVRMQLGEESILLTQYLAPPDGRTIPVPSRSHDLWFEHIAIVVSDMDKAYERVHNHQVQHISPNPQTLPQSNVAAAGIKAFKFRDPDRHGLELLWFPPDKGLSKWHRQTGKLFLGIDHTAIAISDTEASLKFYQDLLGMTIMGSSLNIGMTQEYLDNLFGARVRVTAVAPPRDPPHIEFLQYETPPGGRPMPLDTKANDLWHWQTQLIVNDVEGLAKQLRKHKVRSVSEQVRTMPDVALEFKKGIMVLDPDGHAMLVIEK